MLLLQRVLMASSSVQRNIPRTSRRRYEYFYPDMGADEAAKKRINIQLNSLNESELRLVEGIINAIIENRETEGA